MKKFLLSVILIILASFNFPVFSSEIEEDYLDIAGDYCVIGEYARSMEYLDKILTINPNNKTARDLKSGLTHIMSGDKKSYVSAVNPLVKDAQEQKRRGNSQGEYEALLKGTEVSNSYLAYYYLGNFYRDRKDFVKALNAYNSALSARPDFAQAYLASGIILFNIGKYDSALNPLDKYLTFIPDDDLAYAIKSRAEFQLGMLGNSQIDNNKAIELNDCPEYQFDRAKILYKLGDYSSSKQLFTKLLTDIQTSKIYEYIGFCDLAMEDYMSALMNIDKALILSDDDEYLENKYNEIKKILETKQNAQTSNSEI
jgi:tetratricopeptide (TPR) repeat protein